MAENLSNLERRHKPTYLESWVNPKQDKSKWIHAKIHHNQTFENENKEKYLKSSEKKCYLTFNGYTIQKAVAFSSETMEARERGTHSQVLNEKNYLPKQINQWKNRLWNFILFLKCVAFEWIFLWVIAARSETILLSNLQCCQIASGELMFLFRYIDYFNFI